MNRRSLNYYGYDKETYIRCADLIRSTNRRHLEYVNVWFLLLNTMFIVFSLLNVFGVDPSNFTFHLTFMLIALAMEFVLHLAKRFSVQYVRLFVVCEFAVLISFGTLSSNAQPYMAALMFPVLIVLIGVSFIDQMLTISVILLASSVIFLIFSYQIKALSIFYQDFYNTLIFLSLALTLHFAFQRTRMQQFETYQKNVMIQQELEIKSSFDALTSLLNRGRFFTLAGEVLHGPHDEYMAVCLLDLDGFKQINDRLGHQMGDKAIQIAGQTILETLEIDLSEKWSFPEKVIREQLSFAGRLGGDEFVIFLRGAEKKERLNDLLAQMLSRLNKVTFGELKGIEASFGVVEIGSEDHDIDKIYNRADDALYASKRAGKNRITFSEITAQEGVAS